jgi:hypothetical protein
MGRKITITGRNARYEEHRGVNSSDDTDREIRMEGEEAVYREYAYGYPGEPTRQDDDEAAADDDEDRKQLMANGEYMRPVNESEVIERLRPIFFNNEEEVKSFLNEISGMKDKDITDVVNRWVNKKRISDYGNSRKGDLWEILKDAGLYTKSRQNWNRRVY